MSTECCSSAEYDPLHVVEAPSPELKTCSSILSREKQSIVLSSDQKEHFDRINEILSSYMYYVDSSETGGGKTFVASSVSKHRKLSLFVVAPPMAISSAWEPVTLSYDVPWIEMISYQSLVGRAESGLKHGWLKRENITVGNNTKAVFTVTKRLQDVIDQGILLVFDEAHALKNANTMSMNAAMTLSNAVMKSGGRSRVALLTATLFDKKEHAASFVRILGYVDPERPMFTKGGKPDAITDLIEKCRKMDPDTTADLEEEYRINTSSQDSLISELMYMVILAKTSSAVPSIAYENKEGELIVKDYKDGYYTMKDDEAAILRDAIARLGDAVGYDESTREVKSMENTSFGAITNAMMAVESAKINTFARIIISTLIKNDNCKVIVMVGFVRTIDTLIQLLKSTHELLIEIGIDRDKVNKLALTNVSVLNGEVKMSSRVAGISSFQEDNDNVRILIGTIPTGGQSISLHDLSGNYERTVVVSPGYSAIRMHQVVGRAYRRNVQSNVVARFVYGKVGIREASILAAMSRKAEVLSKVNKVQKESGVLFPGEYPVEENDVYQYFVNFDTLTCLFS